MNSILKIDKKRFKDIKIGGKYYMKVIMFRKLEFIIYIELRLSKSADSIRSKK